MKSGWTNPDQTNHRHLINEHGYTACGKRMIGKVEYIAPDNCDDHCKKCMQANGDAMDELVPVYWFDHV